MLTTEFPQEFNAAVTGLGAPVRYFPVKKFNRIGNLVIAIILIIAALAVAVYGLYTTYVDYTLHGPAVIGDTLPGLLIGAFFLFLLAVWAGWTAYANWNKGVLLYEKGFALRDRKGYQTWRWAETASLKSQVTRHYTNGVYTGTTHVYTLQDKQDQRLKLTDTFHKVEDLAAAIEQNLFPLLYEPAAQQYNLGQPLAFGNVVISKTGLQFGKKSIPWTEMKSVSLRQGQLKFAEKKGGLFSGVSIPVAIIPNLRVLLTIVNQVVGLKTG